ncbi:MAG: hypothetical protein IKI66_01780 [Bacteroidales bacterium]|jgi:hypothetical protein|nr:hypothetical protein [Bacteroidales bacterium]
MVKMSENSRRFIAKYLPEVLNADYPNDILAPLNGLIMQKGFDSFEDGYNAFGYEAQEVYDDIFDSNFDD